MKGIGGPFGSIAKDFFNGDADMSECESIGDLGGSSSGASGGPRDTSHGRRGAGPGGHIVVPPPSCGSIEAQS